MDFNEEKKAAFFLLQKVCNGIVKNPCKEHPNEFKDVTRIVGCRTVQELFDYVLYPIKLRTYNNTSSTSDDTSCILLDCLYQIIECVQFTDEAQFFDVYSIICFTLVGGKNENCGIKECSEELKLKVLNCSKNLFNHSDKKLLDNLLKKDEYYSKLCVLIYNCLQFASKEKSISLRVSALECLLVICRLDTLSISNNKAAVSLEISKFVKKCLPGLITECRAIVSQGHIQNHRITKFALKVWSRSISVVMADCHHSRTNQISTLEDLVKKSKNQPINTHTQDKYTLDHSKKLLPKHNDLTSDWILAAAERLTSATHVFTSVKLHPHHQVRKELVSSIILILSYAPLNMSPSLGSLLDALIVLAEDNDKSISNESNEALEKFKISWSVDRGISLLEDVKECFSLLLNRLPRILHGTDDCMKESDMTLLCGYIQLLGKDHFTEFISSQHLLDKLINCILEACSLDTSNVSVVQELTLRDVDTDWGHTRWRSYKLCDSPQLQYRLERVFQILSSMPNLMDLAFTLIERFNDSPVKRNELMLVINEVVLSSSQLIEDNYNKLVKSIINEYLEPYLWEVESQSKPEITLSNLRRLVLQACLCAEGISKLSVSLGPEKFSLYLFQCLFPLLEYAGSPYGCLAHTGLKSLQIIAKQYKCVVGHLIQNNVDYLSHHIRVKLRSSEKSPTVFYVLSAVMNNSSLNTLPSLMEIINNVLVQSCERFHTNNQVLSYLHVFKSFVSVLHRWIENESKNKENKSAHVDESQKLIDMILDYQSAKHVSDAFEADNLLEESPDNIEENINTKEEDDDKKEVPDYIKLTESIMYRAIHYLPSKVTAQQIDSIQILDRGCLILVDYKDVLLPVVHKIWSPLVKRFDPVNDPLAIRNAFGLLTTLAITSKDFIRQRTLKEVVPKLCSALERLSTMSRLKPQLHAYRYSHNYKLQLEILQSLGDLCINLDISGKEIYSLLCSCLPYLSSTQPLPLQSAGVDVYMKLSKLNKGMVWLHLMSICPDYELLKTKFEFQNSYQIPSNPENNHYKKNVDKLLYQLNNMNLDKNGERNEENENNLRKEK